MAPTFLELIDDIEDLKDRELRSIKKGAELRITEIDREKEKVVVCSCENGSVNSRSFAELHKIWTALTESALTDEPWVHVDSILGGSGSKRNQPETLFINLPYIVHCRHGGKKHIVYVGRNVHPSGTPLEMTEEEIDAELADYRKQARESSLQGKPRNLIYFGAPGTGKSYQLNECAKKCFSEKNIRRVTFYPDYTYSQFVGGYKPFPLLNEKDQPSGDITYKFVPGPFLRTYVQAVQNPLTPHLLIIEEINRANPAAVFGDLFQLLDRNGDGRSVYDLSVPVDMQLYLKWRVPEFHTNDQMGTTHEEHLAYDREDTRLLDETMRISIPPNMYIWATMNSADQGVFPMDTAFKRRWDFRYMGINEGADADIDGVKLSDIKVPCGKRTVKWNDLRMAINDFLLRDNIHVNEDKLLGPFFVAPTSLAPEKFTQVFKDKVLLYLYEDAGKTKHPQLFRSDLKTYSQVCEAFDNDGTAIFNEGFPTLEYCPEPEADTANGPQE